MVSTNYTGTILTTPITNAASQDGYGIHRLSALSSSGVNPIPHYMLACYDNVNVRHFWVDTAISTTNAPAGFTYVSATLVVLGKF